MVKMGAISSFPVGDAHQLEAEASKIPTNQIPESSVGILPLHIDYWRLPTSFSST